MYTAVVGGPAADRDGQEDDGGDEAEGLLLAPRGEKPLRAMPTGGDDDA